jgi:6-phosphogluconolactonase (cycloisomerase 2 family)
VTRSPSIPLGDVAMPSVLTFDPSGKFVYGPCGSYACAFAMDSTSGALAAVPGSPLPAGLARRFVAFHPTGKFAYVANTDVSNSVSSFRVDPENGGLTEVAGSPYATVRNPVSVAVDHGGKHVYVLSAPGTRQQPWWVTWFRPTDAPGGISTFAADSSNGALRLVAGGPVATGLDPVAIAVEPGDRFVYVANRMSGSVSGYASDAITGALQGLVGSPYYLGSVIPAAPSAVAIEPSGRFMYVPIPQEPAGTAGIPSDSFVSALAINAFSGALTAIAGSPFTAGRGSISIAVAPSGRFAYLANFGSGDISAYAIDSAAGALASLPGSPYPVGAYPRAIAIEPGGRFAYVLADGAEEGNIFVYGIDGLTGALTKRLAMRLTACTGTSMSFDPSGRFAYVPCPAGIWILRLDGNTGALTEVPGNPFAPGTLSPVSVAVTN